MQHRVSCPICDRELEKHLASQIIVCPHCGEHVKPRSRLVPPPSGPAETASPAATQALCPRCHSADHVSRVSDAYRDAHLALLAPPGEQRLAQLKPSDLSVVASCAMLPFLCFLLSGCLWAFLYSFPRMNQGLWAGPAELMGPFLMALGIPFLVGSVLVKRYESHILARASDPPRWQREHQLWESLYYCARHDGVFVPGETALVPAEKMRAFLESY